MLQIGVGFRALVDGIPVLEERGDVYFPRRQQVKEGFHVAPFGPADIPNGVVNPTFLILRVIPSRPVRARESQRQLFGVHVASRHSHADVTHDDDPATIPQNSGCHLNRFSGRSRGGQDRGIDAVPGELSDAWYQRRVVGNQGEVCA